MSEFNLFIWLGERFKPLSWVDESTVHIASAIFVAIVLLLMALVSHRSLKRANDHLVPASRLSVAGFFDILAEGVHKIMDGVMPGGRAIKYLPLIGSLFLYIFFCNLLSLLPGFLPPTDNINTNLPCAVIVFLYYNYIGMKEQGVVRYLKHMAGPIIWLAPLMFTVEMVSHLVRPVSLSVRLFGNITGDHVVLGIFSELIPILVPVIFLFLALFVAFIQAFVFSLLSTVYIALATEHE